MTLRHAPAKSRVRRKLRPGKCTGCFRLPVDALGIAGNRVNPGHAVECDGERRQEFGVTAAASGPTNRQVASPLDRNAICGVAIMRVSMPVAGHIPHDFLMLSDDHQRVRVMTLSGDLPVMPGNVVLPEAPRGPIEGGGDFVLSDIALSAHGAGVHRADS